MYNSRTRLAETRHEIAFGHSSSSEGCRSYFPVTFFCLLVMMVMWLFLEDLLGLRFNFCIETMYVEQEMHNEDGVVLKQF